ncbi:MAG: hypothetical protein LBG65_07620 [Puniceicoccales bacterium]|jgi:hypothetical protein|nr:hypothetical protein [Puniceicoccales bacterium]
MRPTTLLLLCALAGLAQPPLRAGTEPTPAGAQDAVPQRTPGELAFEEYKKYQRDEDFVRDLARDGRADLRAWREAPKQVERRAALMRGFLLVEECNVPAARRLAHDYERYLEQNPPIEGAPSLRERVLFFKRNDRRHYLFRHAPLEEVRALPPGELPMAMHILATRNRLSKAQREEAAADICSKAEKTGQVHGEYIAHLRRRLRALPTAEAIELLSGEIRSHVGLDMNEDRKRVLADHIATLDILREVAGLPAPAPDPVRNAGAAGGVSLRSMAAPTAEAMRIAGIRTLPPAPKKHGALDFWRRRLDKNPAATPADWARYYTAASNP